MPRPSHPRFVEEIELHDRVRARDRSAVLQFVERSGDLVFSCLLDLTDGDRRLAENLTEQAFVALWRSPESFDPHHGPVALQLLREASSSLRRATRGHRPDPGSDGMRLEPTPQAA